MDPKTLQSDPASLEQASVDRRRELVEIVAAHAGRLVDFIDCMEQAAGNEGGLWDMRQRFKQLKTAAMELDEIESGRHAGITARKSGP